MALGDYENSPELSELEKLVLRYAEGMTQTPVVVSDEMFAELRRHFNEAQLVEITSAIAWENYRARFDHALGIESDGFSDGASCPLPEAAAKASRGYCVSMRQSWKSPTLWKYTLSEMRRRPARTVLTLLGIVVGVAAIVAISLTTTTTRHAYARMFESLAGKASLEIVAEGWGFFDGRIATDVRSVGGVAAVVPTIQAPTVLLGEGSGVSAFLLAVDPSSDHAVRDYTLREGRLLEGGDEALLEAGFAKAQGLQLGDTARLLTPTPTPTGPLIANLRVVGLLEPRGAAGFNGGAVVFVPLSTGQRLFARKGQVSALQIVLASAPDPRTVEESIRKLLPSGLTVQTPATRGGIAQDSLMSTEVGLATLSMVSLVAGCFVILNSFLMSLGERRRQLAILRALGATRRQVTLLLLREAVLLGLAGTILGCVGGWALSLGLHRMMTQLLTVVLPDPEVAVSPFIVGCILGPGMAIAATYWPARRAGRRALLQDLLQKREVAGERKRHWLAYLGVALVVSMLMFEMALVANWFPPSLIPSLLAPMLAIGLVGCVLAIPLVLTPFIRLAEFLLNRVLGVEGQIALRQLGRQRARTSLTVGVLFIAVVVSIGFGQSLQNNIHDLHRWREHNVGYDFMIRGIMPDTTTIMTAAAIPENLADRIAELGGIERVTKVSFVLARLEGRQIIALPLSISPTAALPFALEAGDPEDVRTRLLQGEIILGTALSQRLGIKVGDFVTVESRQGPRRLRVAGTTTEYTVGGMAAYLDWNTGKDLFALRGVHVFGIAAHNAGDAGLADRLQAFCNQNGLRLQSQAEFRKVLDDAVSAVLGSIWMLIVLVFVVASLGVVNTLTMNVLEQTRAIGILRAVAMKRGQVRKMILAQALALGIISMVPGALIGIGLAYLMKLATSVVLGHSVQFHLDLSLVLGCFGVGLVIAILAGLLPARRAARLQVIQALQYE
jgi:putative ABC transport system permease protein